MIFKNTFRLIVSNFSSVWKLLLYYVICIALTVLVCGWFLVPLIRELSVAGVFASIVDFFSQIFSRPVAESAEVLSEIWSNIMEILQANVSLKFNSIFIMAWMLFVLPLTIKMGELACGEVLYGYMTSAVKYGFTGRYIKNFGKSFVFSLVSFFVGLIFNILMLTCFYFAVHFFIIGGFNIALAVLCLALLCVLCALKIATFSAWMPSIAVLDLDAFRALKMNFKTIKRNFLSIFSNMLLFIIFAIVFNLVFAVFTATISLFITLPLTAFAFIVARMVAFFFSHGMKFYVYPDMVISPKTFEEQDCISQMKHLI